jgi:hypothetical protein
MIGWGGLNANPMKKPRRAAQLCVCRQLFESANESHGGFEPPERHSHCFARQRYDAARAFFPLRLVRVTGITI